MFYMILSNPSVLNVSLYTAASLLTFCLNVLPPIDVSRLLKTPIIIVLVAISPFGSVFFFFFKYYILYRRIVDWRRK